ncbi:hypothetical protein KF840_12050 [bacterium]|nr:hypothetical protein [bacterium]
MCSRRLLTLGGSIAVSLLVAGNAFAALTGAEQKCIDGYNNFLRLVSAQAGKSATACVKTATKDGSSPNTCIVTNTDGKIAGKETKVTGLYPAKCTGSEPIQQGAVTGNAAHRNSATELAHALFGDPTGTLSNDKADAKCLQKIVQRSTQAFTAIILAHRACVKNGMKSGTITDATSLDATCGTFAQIDSGNKAAGKLAAVSADASGTCGATTSSLASLFDGLPAGCTNNTTNLGNCVVAKTRCVACRTLNAADGQNIDCDVFDDGSSNYSCEPIGAATCTLDASSQLALGTAALSLPLAASGTLNIACGSAGPDGAANCTCDVGAFAPIVIMSLGDVCVHPAAGCTPGKIDCNGGTSLNASLVADHDIGSCSGDANCKTQCDAYCGGISSSRLTYGCEGFCQGGSNHGGACTLDSQCPGGQCPGKDPVPPAHAGTCNCSCQSQGLGAPAAAGNMACEVGTQIDVELPSNGTCGDTVTIALPPICGGVTTTTASGGILNADKAMGITVPPYGTLVNPPFGYGTYPNSLTGVATSCASLSGSSVSGLKLVGHLAFPDSTLGDILAMNSFVCQ